MSYANSYARINITSPVEAVNRYLKSFVVTGNSTIKEVMDQCFNMADSMKERIAEEEQRQKQRLRYDYLGKEWLGDTPLTVSYKAIDLLND